MVQPDEETILKLAQVLDLFPAVLQDGLGGSYVVHRGESWTWPPKVSPFSFVDKRESPADNAQDPVLYRLYEVLVVYGVCARLLPVFHSGLGRC